MTIWLIILLAGIALPVLRVSLVGSSTRHDRADAASEQPPATVLVLTASYGRGHDAAAETIADELGLAGESVRVVDVVDLFPLGLGPLLKRAYFAQLRRAPGSWEATLGAMSGSGSHAFLRSGVQAVLALLLSRPVHALLGPQMRLAVATHPFGSAVLGDLRRSGRTAVPTATYLCDPSVHALWVHPGIDRHVALYAEAADSARRLGAADVMLSRPALGTSVCAGAGPLAGLRLTCRRPVALLVGGSEGVGDLEQAAYDVAATGLVTTVVACGHNESLRRRLAGRPGVTALGWQDDLARLVSDVDVVVNNAGGFTTLEALAAGTPLVFYRCLPGHGRDNAAALEREGLARWAQTTADLPVLLAGALGSSHGHRPVLPVTTLERASEDAPWSTRPSLSAGLGWSTLAPATTA